MNIKYAIFSKDDNPKYDGLWPIVSEVCFKMLNIKPVLFKISEIDTDFIEDKYGLVKNIKGVSGINTGRQSQIIRMWATKYFPDDVCIISDIDMMMLSKEYFVDQVSSYSDDDLIIYISDAYDSNRPECVGIYSNRYLLPYNAAKGKKFNQILDTDCDFKTYVERVLSYGFPDFDSDEMYFTECVNNKDHGVNIIKLIRGYYSNFQCPKRIDRINDEQFNIYDDNLLFNGYYVDAHLARPYSKYKKETDLLKNKIISKNKKEVYLIGCHIDNIRKVSYLAELTNELNYNNKDFILSSHTLIPDIIISESKAFIYDSVNPKYKNWELSNKNKYIIETSSFSIESPYILWGRNDYYHVGVIRLLINGIKYLQNLDYEIIHWIEYDALPILKEENENRIRLEDHDFIFYGIGSRFSFNLNKVNQEFLKWNNDEILDSLKRNSYAAEILISNELIVGSKLTFDVKDKSDFYGRNSNNFDYLDFDWSLFERDDKVFIFLNNHKSKKNLEVSIGTKEVKKINLEIDFWYIEFLFTKHEVENIKIHIDNKPFQNIELKNKKTYSDVVKSVIVNFK
jgi:hypothetical protein